MAHSSVESRWPIALAVLLFASTAAVYGEFPLVWDFDGRSDRAVGSGIGADGDLWVLSESYLQNQGTPRGVLLRIDGSGAIVWSAVDPLVAHPVALAVRPDGVALAIGRAQGELDVTAFDAAGAVSWSRSRTGLEPDYPFSGPSAAPIWDEGAGVWRIPAGVAGDFAVISYAANGDPLPDLLWSPPAGVGRATSVLPRPQGGLLLAGTAEDASPPGWWVVALDAAGGADWSRFEDGETAAGIFSGAFLLSADPVRVWADDETACGLFSLRLWSLTEANGAPLWDATWPTNGFPGCEVFIPDSVQLVGDRIFAAGVAKTTTPPTSFDPIAVALDAGSGELEWARAFTGSSTGLVSHLAPRDGSVLLASTLFAMPSPGPTPLWLSAWDRAGVSCGSPVALLPARVQSALALPGGGAVVIGDAFGGATADDLVVQRVDSPCAALFADGFASGDASAWSAVTP